MGLRVELDTKFAGLRVYGDDPIHAEASCLLYFYIDKAIISQMQGHNLLPALAEYLPTLGKDYGIKTLEGYVLTDIARACRIICHRYGGVYEEREHCSKNGKDYIWVILRLKEQNE